MNNPSTCPHFSTCSGCQTPDLNPPIWQEVLSFLSPLKPHLFIEGFLHTRHKAKLAIQQEKIGLYKEHSHEIISIPHCLVHHPSINEAISILKKEHCSAHYVQFHVERSTGLVQLALMTTQEEPDLYRRLLKYPLFHSLWLNLHATLSNRILSDTWVHIHGPKFLWQTIDNTPIAFHPAAFCQNHLSLFEKMVQKIKTYISPADQILELYAGVGSISLPLSQKAPHITLVESNPFAHLSFLQTQSPLSYHCIDAKEAELDGYDTYIVDPPRKGLDPILLQKLSLERGKLIYVSCGFNSFKRDALALLAKGWEMKEANGYLLFPGTNHVEILALLEKESG
jgi:tRNA/tmRNA/rRNA uracil-C5-methylase (TrmA/RlmC/RlmD family)